MKEEIKGEGFTIIDKRSSAQIPESQKAELKEKVALPEVDFSSFIFSLSTSALIHFGLIADPMTKKTEKNLPLAKQTIDLLAMLKDKTKGNLTNEEAELLDRILYDLRMRYVKETKL